MSKNYNEKLAAGWLLTCLLTVAITFNSFAQDTGSIKGTVKSSDGQHAEMVNVGLKGTSKGTTTNDKGEYEINKVEAGFYTLVISFVSFETREQQIEVRAGKTTFVPDITLKESEQHLQAVEIVGRKEQSYKSDYSFSATKTETAVKDIPQTISTVTKELIQDQQSYRLNDVVKNVAGINQFSAYDDITMRGFRNSGRGGRLINGLRSYNNFWTSPLLVNIERVEVIKGPASAMFSNTNPGGTVNMVTKKPLDEKRMGFNFTTGSWNAYRAAADFTGPLDEDKALLYRLNIGYENAESFRDYTPHETLVAAPSITFLPNENTRLNFDLVYTQNNTVLDRGRPVKQGEQNLFATPINLTLTQPGDFLNANSLALTLSLNQKLAKNISFNASYMKFRYDEL
jgi:iron complex outermembrane receptor protein